eukprot:8131400-Pyramimonas_sp.AAC.1
MKSTVLWCSCKLAPDSVAASALRYCWARRARGFARPETRPHSNVGPSNLIWPKTGAKNCEYPSLLSTIFCTQLFR